MPAIIKSQQAEIEKREIQLHGLIRDFLAAQDVRPNSRATYARQLKRWAAWLQETGLIKDMGSLQEEDILAYKASLIEAKMSPFSVNGYLTAVRKLYTWLEGKKLYPNVARGAKGLKKPKGHFKDTLTKDQARLALEAFDTSSLEGLRDFALFNLMIRTGLRDIEAQRASVGDIRQQDGQAVLWIQGKGRDSKDEFVILLPETLQPIRAWLQARAMAMGKPKDQEPLFSSLSLRNMGEALTPRSISRIIKQALREVGLNDSRLSAHSLRHTAITLAIQGGASLHQAQAMARHSSSDTTMIYFHNLARISQGAERYISL